MLKDQHDREISTPMPCKALRFLYRTVMGRILLKALISKVPAKLSALFLNSPLSRPLIKNFIKKNHIDTSRYEARRYRSYNDYFTRRQKEGVTVFPQDPTLFTAPCDSRLSVYEISEDSIFRIKESDYSVTELLENAELAKEFCGGYCMIFRLSVDDYHRYSFIDGGTTENSVSIKGVLHTVQPIATERYNIYKRNAREYTVLNSDHFGKLVYVEVGALLIGKICNHKRMAQRVERGEEKGYFEYGGSTVVILCPKDVIKIQSELLKHTLEGYETRVRLGDVIASADSM